MLPSKEAASYLWFGSGIPRKMGFGGESPSVNSIPKQKRPYLSQKILFWFKYSLIF